MSPRPVFDRVRRQTLDTLAGPRLRERTEASAPVLAARRRFVAGPTVGDAVDTALDLGRTGRRASIEPLCPPVTDETQLSANVRSATEALDAAILAKGDTHATSPLGVVLAPARLGLGRSEPEAFRQTLGGLLDHASGGGVGITLRTVAPELEDELQATVASLWSATSPPPLRISVLARRHRGERDCARLADLGIPVRLVRGGPREGSRTAWSDRHEADLAYVRCLSTLLASGPRPMVATQDPALLEVTDALAEHHGRGRDVEYQVYLGAQPELQVRSADAGHLVRVLVPYGPEWFDYLADLAERPATLRRLVTLLTGQG